MHSTCTYGCSLCKPCKTVEYFRDSIICSNKWDFICRFHCIDPIISHFIFIIYRYRKPNWWKGFGKLHVHMLIFKINSRIFVCWHTSVPYMQDKLSQHATYLFSHGTYSCQHSHHKYVNIQQRISLTY